MSFKADLVQIQFENLSVRIFSSRELEIFEKEELQGVLNEYTILYMKKGIL